MDELDKLKRAKLYLTQLAEGIDPISGQEMEGDAVLNHVRLSRCFFYVAEVLERVIANGGQVSPAPVRAAKTSFVLDEERLPAIPVSDVPLTIIYFCRNITAVRENKTRRRVTEQGLTIGLSEEERNNLEGPYLAILYNAAAQRFIIHNLPAILQGRGVDKG